MKEKLRNLGKRSTIVSILIIVIALEVCVIFFSEYHNNAAATFSTKAPVASSMRLETSHTATSQTQININTATKEQLKSLPSIGDVIAQRIIDYRTQHGNFKNTSQLKNVKGIGEKTYTKIKELIKVD